MNWGRWVALMIVGWAGAAGAAPVVDGAGGRAGVELATALYSRGAADLGRRTVLAHRLDVRSDLTGAAGAAAGLGWVTLHDRDRGGVSATTSVPGNALFSFWSRLRPPGPWPLVVDLGVTLVADLDQSASPDPTARAAHTHAVAMHAGYDSWVFADGRMGIVLPLRVALPASLGERPGRIELASALLFLLPEQNTSQDSFKKMVQASLAYHLWPADWWFASLAVRAVWMPSAVAFRDQVSGSGGAGLAWGRWRFGLGFVASFDEPYGWSGNGAGLWSLTTDVGMSW